MEGSTKEHFQPKYPDTIEPHITEQEARETLSKSPNNKAEGIDGITTEAVKACGELGVKWLTYIFNKAWQERVIPIYSQRAVLVLIW